MWKYYSYDFNLFFLKDLIKKFDYEGGNCNVKVVPTVSSDFTSIFMLYFLQIE